MTNLIKTIILCFVLALFSACEPKKERLSCALPMEVLLTNYTKSSNPKTEFLGIKNVEFISQISELLKEKVLNEKVQFPIPIDSSSKNFINLKIIPILP